MMMLRSTAKDKQAVYRYKQRYNEKILFDISQIEWGREQQKNNFRQGIMIIMNHYKLSIGIITDLDFNKSLIENHGSHRMHSMCYVQTRAFDIYNFSNILCFLPYLIQSSIKLTIMDDSPNFPNTNYQDRSIKKHLIISVKHKLNNPKDLLDKETFNQLYDQSWNQSQISKQLWQASLDPNSSTHNQCRAIPKNNQSPKKQNLSSPREILGLYSEEWYLKFGQQKVYERFTNRTNVRPIKSQKNREQLSFVNGESQQLVSTITNISFNSKFQSGNLLSVFKNGDPLIFTLLLHNDTNTRGYTNWFYFSAKSYNKYETVKFQIANMRKKCSLFSKGMKIAICKQNEEGKLEWGRGGENIVYCETPFTDENGNQLFTLSFEYTFLKSQSWVYFATSYPYTYSDLKQDLKAIKKSTLFNTYQISSTLLKNEILAVENKQILIASEKNIKKKSLKDIIVVIARAHPCESMSSFVMRGFLYQMLAKSDHVDFLRSNFIFKIIPMLNPDGVIHGNSRTSAAGNDLNRRWANPSPLIHPQVYHIKQSLKNLEKKGHRIFMMIDLHGHSMNENAFFYGCNRNNKLISHRLIAAYLQRLDDNFNKRYCSYSMTQDKFSTARITFWRQFNSYSYTLQSSFLGSSKKFNHFSIKDYEDLGRNLVKSIYFFILVCQPSIKKVLSPQDAMIKNSVISGYNDDIDKNDENESNGSSSRPSEFNYEENQLQSLLFDNRNGHSKTKNHRYSNFVRNQSHYHKNNASRNSNTKLRKLSQKGSFLDRSKKSFVSFQSKELEGSPKKYKLVPQFNTLNSSKQKDEFSAFNFKTRKGALTRKKLLIFDQQVLNN